ncbi:Polymorphic outer membrane protein [Seminavis robusta]|uniref:Polymorphic outer membrane protein n=1 Tax=Seminavis robusta TaxID=568900 RepID=A0A9N8ERH1_9STRA|nr:Polymorphic outer membrane protein [Seminavis robusta]|eukprot:Sro1676_g290470.1 Polymorphic outer membrane protein (367) ;mRNA; r:7988-9088
MRFLALVILVILANLASCQDDGNLTVVASTMAVTTEAPTEAGSDVSVAVETDAPSDMDADGAATNATDEGIDTVAPTEMATMTQSSPDGDANMAEAPDMTTVAPTEEATMAVTADATPAATTAVTTAETMAVTDVDVDLGANGTVVDDLAQVAVGNVTLETDETATPTISPTISPDTQAPTVMATTLSPTQGATPEATAQPTLRATPAATPAATAVATPGATPGATAASTADGTTGVPVPATSPGEGTASPTVQVGVGDITVIEPSPTSDPNTCAATLLNTDPVCGQLLKFTNAVCDCYNFCSGQLIGCLEFGEQSSFSCAGETVAGCTADQKTASSAPRGTRLLSSSLWWGAVVAAVAAIPSSFL